MNKLESLRAKPLTIRLSSGTDFDVYPMTLDDASTFADFAEKGDTFGAMKYLLLSTISYAGGCSIAEASKLNMSVEDRKLVMQEAIKANGLKTDNGDGKNHDGNSPTVSE
jgi:hypothetical protein